MVYQRGFYDLQWRTAHISDMNQAEQHIEETEMTVLPSRAFQGNDWSEHANVKRLIDALFGEYEIWYREEASGKRIVGPDKIRQHLTQRFLMVVNGNPFIQCKILTKNISWEEN